MPTLLTRTVPAPNYFYLCSLAEEKSRVCLPSWSWSRSQAQWFTAPDDELLLPQLQPIERVSDLSAPYISESALQPSNTLIDMWMEFWRGWLILQVTEPLCFSWPSASQSSLCILKSRSPWRHIKTAKLKRRPTLEILPIQNLIDIIILFDIEKCFVFF